VESDGEQMIGIQVFNTYERHTSSAMQVTLSVSQWEATVPRTALESDKLPNFDSVSLLPAYIDHTASTSEEWVVGSCPRCPVLYSASTAVLRQSPASGGSNEGRGLVTSISGSRRLG
jgi:hypothetical protein